MLVSPRVPPGPQYVLCGRWMEKPHLEVVWAELVAVHVNGRQENGLHLVVPQLIGGEVGGNQDLHGERTEGLG